MGDSNTESAKKIEEEVGRVVEQAKELQDSTASFISKTSSDDQSLRQRALSIDSSIRRLRSLVSHNQLLDPKLADKAIIHLSLHVSLQFNWIPFNIFLIFSWKKIYKEPDVSSLMETLLLSFLPNFKVLFLSLSYIILQLIINIKN
jgi:hypothetical protein